MSRLTYTEVYTTGLEDQEVASAFEQALDELRSDAVDPLGHYVDGEPVYEGETFDRNDPCNRDHVIARVHAGDKSLIDRAVAGARRAQPSWEKLPYEDRCGVIGQTVPLIRAREAEFAGLLSLETGKTRADAFAEVGEVIALIELYCDQMEQNDGFMVPMKSPGEGISAVSVLRPYGVFGVIAPFNFPLALPVNMFVAALVTGNTVVLKPSALSPRCGAGLCELFLEAGVPPSVLQLIHGGASTGQALVLSDLDGLAFTGSAEVGLGIARQLQQGSFVRPLIAEMGGKNPTIVTDAADVDAAAQAVVRSAFGMSGQKCNACSRVVVTDGVYDEFVERICALADDLKIGDPSDAGSFTGPVINEAAVERFEHAVEQARQDGEVRTGGTQLSEHGHYLTPTVVTGLPRGHELTREELFLPFLTVTRVNDFDQALDEANEVRYGLTAGIFSEDDEEVDRFLREVDAGVIFTNHRAGATTGAWPGVQTFTGWKASGSTGKGGFGPYYLQGFMREQSRTIAS